METIGTYLERLEELYGMKIHKYEVAETETEKTINVWVTPTSIPVSVTITKQ